MGLSKKDAAFVERALFAFRQSVGDEADQQRVVLRKAINKMIGKAYGLKVEIETVSATV